MYAGMYVCVYVCMYVCVLYVCANVSEYINFQGSLSFNLIN